ncbi:MAG: discoidin domain-containing protein, partial [Tepidisphaerales bacterium]
MRMQHFIIVALVGVLASAVSAATIRKADDTLVNGEVAGLRDGKVLVAKPGTVIASGAKLSGTVIGTEGSWNNEGHTREKAFDGDLTTYFDGPTDVSWVGLNLGSAKVITQIRYAPRPGEKYAARMVGGKFQGSTTADFSAGVVDLYTIGTIPPEGVLTAQPITVSTPFRYVRYVSAAEGYGNVAEVVFEGAAPAAPVVTGAETPVALEDIAIITLREKPRPVEPNANTGMSEEEQSVMGGLVNFF